MPAAVVVLAVLSALLAVLLWRESSRHRQLRAEAAAQAEQQQQQIATATQVADDAATALAGATSARDAAEARARAADERAAAAEQRAAAADALVEQASHDAEAAHDRALEVESERLQLLTSLAESEDRMAHLSVAAAERDELVAQVTPLRERLLQLEADDRRHLDTARPGIEAEALWALELARSERTWRHSVAASPDGPGPFADVDAEAVLRTAVEIEVAALREDVGAAMELHWDATVTDPARCLTVLRLAQELLAAAARQQQAVIIHGHLDEQGDVVIRLSVPEDHDLADIEVPPLGANLLSVRTPDGLEVTVR